MKISRIISLISLILTGGLIFYISSLQFPPNPFPGLSITSLVYHFGIFFLFGVFAFLSLGAEKRYTFFAFIFCSVYAGLDEVHQYFVPNRVMSLADFGIDVFGVIIGIVFILIAGIFLKKR